VKGVANLRCSLIFEICLFFNEIDAEVLDGTRLSRVPRVRGVNLHIFKAGGLGVHHAHHLFIVDEELDLSVSVFYLLEHSDLGPLVNCGGREVYLLVHVVVERIDNDKALVLAWVEKDSRNTVAKVFLVSSDCHVEDAGPVWVVIVGRLEQELHHPLAWQGRQSGQEIVLSHREGVLNLENGVPVPLCLDAEVLDGTRLCWMPWVRGVNLHALKAGG